MGKSWQEQAEQAEQKLRFRGGVVYSLLILFIDAMAALSVQYFGKKFFGWRDETMARVFREEDSPDE